MDATYRADLRELNELNFARFDAKVEQRFAQQDAKFERRLAELRSGLMTWIVGLWITSALGFAGIILTLLRR